MQQEDIIQVVADRFDAINENAPAPENILDKQLAPQHTQSWGWDGMEFVEEDKRKILNIQLVWKVNQKPPSN